MTCVYIQSKYKHNVQDIIINEDTKNKKYQTTTALSIVRISFNEWSLIFKIIENG